MHKKPFPIEDGLYGYLIVSSSQKNPRVIGCKNDVPITNNPTIVRGKNINSKRFFEIIKNFSLNMFNKEILKYFLSYLLILMLLQTLNLYTNPSFIYLLYCIIVH